MAQVLSRTPEYLIWADMKCRCQNTKHKWYPSYGGRGIYVCDEWQKFANFLRDMGNRPSKDYSIERVNNDGPYSKENCKWATRSEQQRNKREYKLRTDARLLTYNGLTHNLRGWSRISGIKYTTLKNRYERRWPPEQILDSKKPPYIRREVQ